MINGTSAYLEISSPSLALWINPFNTDARINTLIVALGGNDTSQLGELEKIAESGIRLAPHDARGYSVLGEIKQRQGRGDEAQKLYGEALLIAPTEIHALINRLNEAGRAGDFEVALEAMDVILRRWSKYAENVLPAVDYFIGEPKSAEWFRSTLATEPPWRGIIISHLISSPAGIDFVQNLLLYESTKGKPQNQAELSRTITTLLRGEAADQAYRLFQLTLNDDERPVRGYVFDSAFMLTPSGKPFDWVIEKTTDADVEFANLALAEDEQGLRVSFRNSPAKRVGISQLLKLDPGQYRLSATATARNLDAPKGLKWVIVCQAPGATPLTQLQVQEKTYRLKELSTDFTVPPEGCPLQLLTLRTEETTTSWRMRYNGTVTFKYIRVTSNP